MKRRAQTYEGLRQSLRKRLSDAKSRIEALCESPEEILSHSDATNSESFRIKSEMKNLPFVTIRVERTVEVIKTAESALAFLDSIRSLPQRDALAQLFALGERYGTCLKEFDLKAVDLTGSTHEIARLKRKFAKRREYQKYQVEIDALMKFGDPSGLSFRDAAKVVMERNRVNDLKTVIDNGIVVNKWPRKGGRPKKKQAKT